MSDIVLSIVIPNWNGKAYLETCLNSLRSQTYAHLEIIVVDNASEDGSQAYIQQNYPEVKLIELSENRGFTGACNAGFVAAQGGYICLLNNDTEVDKHWAEAVVSAFERYPEAGMVACKMLLFNQRDRIHTAGDYFTVDGKAGNRGVWQQDDERFNTEQFVFSACGGSSVYRRIMLDQIGLLDEDFFFLLEDVDLGWRAQLTGWRCLYTPDAIVYHHLSATGGGVTASYYAGRNSIMLLVKNYPRALWKRYRWIIIREQLRDALEALKAWRGEASRARLKGMLAGLMLIVPNLRKRRQVQALRTVSIDYIESILLPQNQTNHE